MSEFNVCGVLVMASPKSSAVVETTLNAMDGVQVHANENGKLVVTVEGPNNRDFINQINDFANIKGVLSTSLVYHEIQSEDVSTNYLNATAVTGQELTQ